MGNRRGAAALGLLLCAATAPAMAAPWASPPKAGAQAFLYEVEEAGPGSSKGYRTDFRLRRDGKGGVTAEIIASQTIDRQVSTPVATDAACLAAMGARPGELASVRLYPLTKKQAKLGDAFLAPCAPAGAFFPLTDILNVALILASDSFNVRELTKPGDKASFAGFSTSLDRLGVQMTEASDGGEVALVSMDNDQATIDWKPAPAKITLVEQAGGSAVHLSGTETFAFRVVVERHTGALARANTLYDNLDLIVAVPGLPADKSPRVAVKRTVVIARR